MFSPSDLGKDSERTRLSRSSPRTPVFSILNQSLLAGIAVSRYVIKLGITIHNVFSWWARVKKEKKKVNIFNYIKAKISSPILFTSYTFKPQCSFCIFCFFQVHATYMYMLSHVFQAYSHLFLKKKKSILLKSILGFLSFKKRYLYDNIKL